MSLSFVFGLKKNPADHFLSKRALAELDKNRLMNSLFSETSSISTETLCDNPSISSVSYLWENFEMMRFDFTISFCGDFKLMHFTLQMKWHKSVHPVMYHCSSDTQHLVRPEELDRV